MAETVVPDASVLLKWAFQSPDEPDTDRAMSFLRTWMDGRVEIVLPKLWSFEVGNVLMMKSPDLAPKLMEIFIGYRFREIDTTVEVCRETFRLMKKYRVTFFDAVYHAVAGITTGILLTADESYWRKARDEKNVERLRDWQL
jgi:predicted nucleic acid-binding protein